jgi:hypothetical protein
MHIKKEQVLGEDITILNKCAPNVGTHNFIKQRLFKKNFTIKRKSWIRL